MKHFLLVLFVALSSAGMLIWQSHQAEALRQSNAGLRAQLHQDEQIAARLEVQNDSAQKLLEEREVELTDLERQLAAAAKLPTSPSPTGGESNGWRDDVAFVRLSKEHLTSLSVGILAKDASSRYHLSAPAATLLGLSPEERSGVNEAIGNLCEQYLALELDRAPQIPSQQRTREGIEHVFVIPSLKSEGADLKRSFMESLTGVIGRARTDLILQYGGDHDFYRQLAGFGENSKSIELVEVRDNRGQPQIKAYVHLKGPRQGGYMFKPPANNDDPNANLCRALWERVPAAEE